jgi:tripartite-type tricarboxylate transporter receptor subunit TctC
MQIEDVTSYENSKSKITIFMEKDLKDKSIHFLKHIQEKDTDNEQLIRYSLEMFMAEHYKTLEFIKSNLAKDGDFFKQVINLKTSKDE